MQEKGTTGANLHVQHRYDDVCLRDDAADTLMSYVGCTPGTDATQAPPPHTNVGGWGQQREVSLPLTSQLPGEEDQRPVTTNGNATSKRSI